MILTLPFLLLLLYYWPLNLLKIEQSAVEKNNRQVSIALRLVIEKIPLFFLAAMSSAVTVYSQSRGGAVVPLDLISFKVRVANALVSYVKYMWKMVYPSKLAVFYPHPGMLPWWQVAGACFLLITISFWAIRTIKQRPYFAVGWLWYLGTLVPVIGLVQVGSASMACRYSYIPLIGLFIMIAWGVPELVEQWRYRKILLTTLAAVSLTIFTVATWKQAGYWRNSITLFEHSLKITSDNYVSYYNLGLALNKQGRTAEAIKHYKQAIRIKPYFEKAHNNLGVALEKQGRIAEAIKHYLQALRIKPDHESAHNNLGNALDNQGRTEEAIKHYLQALRIKPDFEKAHNNLAIALFRKGDIKGAITHLRKALQINPDYIHAKNNLKKVLMMQRKSQ
jgi:tetratricopeptide (TPR) repeat protein